MLCCRRRRLLSVTGILSIALGITAFIVLSVLGREIRYKVGQDMVLMGGVNVVRVYMDDAQYPGQPMRGFFPDSVEALRRLPGVGMLRAVQAVTSLLPLASDIPHPVACMQVGGTEAPYRSALQREALAVLAREGVAGEQAEGVERFAFYERVKKAYAIVVTGELQPFGNFLLRKGVIGETLRD